MYPRLLFIAVTGLLLYVAAPGCTQEDPVGGKAKTTVGDMAQPSSSEPSPDTSESPSQPPRPTPPPLPGVKRVASVTLGDMPDRAAKVCANGPPLEDICPRLLPVIRRSHPYLIDAFGRAGGDFQLLELAAGAPRSDFKRNRPPDVVHVVLETGDPSKMISLVPTNFSPVPLKKAFIPARPRATEVDVRDQGWNERLILAPNFPSGGAHGDHLIYRRSHKGFEQRISLHLWTPLQQPVQVLKAMVRSVK